jgi:hypothetical protein
MKSKHRKAFTAPSDTDGDLHSLRQWLSPSCITNRSLESPELLVLLDFNLERHEESPQDAKSHGQPI